MKPIALLPCLFLAAIIGCSEEKEAGSTQAPAVSAAPAEDSAEATVNHIMEGVKNGQPVVAWRALPDSYQSDVNELVQTFGKNMDAQTWEQVTGLLNSVHSVLDTKQEFIFNHPAIAESKDPETRKKSITHVTGLLKTILDGLGTLEALQTFDGGKFMETTGVKVAEQVIALKAMMPEEGAPVQLMAFGDVKVETIESTDSSAKLKFVKADGQTEETDFVKFEGKWLPKDMVDDWAHNMAEAREGLAALPQQADQMRMQAMGLGGMIAGMLSPLQSAETQEQFNTSVEGLVAGAEMFVPMLGGGGGTFAAPAPPSDSLNDSFGTEPANKEERLEPAGK